MFEFFGTEVGYEPRRDIVFLGGYNLLPLRWEAMGLAGVGEILSHPLIGALVFLGKATVGLTFYIWLRATLPRLRYDQLMSLGWKSLLPLATGNFIVVALWILFTKVYGAGVGWIASLLLFFIPEAHQTPWLPAALV